MAFPAVQTRNTSVVETAETTHTVSLPSGIVSGNLLIAVFEYATTGNTITWPSGWTPIPNGAAERTTGSTEGCATAYRQADGTEGASISVTSSVATRSNHITLRITGHENPATQAPEAANVTGVNGVANPPSLAPTGGAKDYLWIAVGAQHRDSTAADYTGPPSSYSNLTTSANASTGANFTCGGTAERQLNAASEDPGLFAATTTVSEWVGITIAVHPAAGGTTYQKTGVAVLI